MRIITFAPALALSISFLLSPNAFGAELIHTPSGMVIRSITAWESLSHLDVDTDGDVRTIPATAERLDYMIPFSSNCKQLRYRTSDAETSQARPWINLSHLCQIDSSQVSFVFISDTQEFHAEHETAANFLTQLFQQTAHLRFVLNGGDLVQKGLESEWRTYREIAERYARQIPLIPVLGNHEFFDDRQLNWFNFLYNNPGTEKHYYALDLGPVTLIVLNSNIDKLTNDEAIEQTAWLEDALAEHSRKKPILVTFHHPAYSSGVANLIMPGPPAYIRKNWIPLFASYGVRLVLNGHEHVYERLNVDGIPHLLAGPAGGKIGRVKPLRDSHSTFLQPKIRTASIVTARNNGEIAIKTFDIATGTIIDQIGL